MFVLVGVEAATLILAGEHLVDFVDLNVSVVVFFRYGNAPHLWLSSKMCRTVRGASVRMQEKCGEIYSGWGYVEVHRIYVWLILAVRSV